MKSTRRVVLATITFLIFAIVVAGTTWANAGRQQQPANSGAFANKSYTVVVNESMKGAESANM